MKIFLLNPPINFNNPYDYEVIRQPYGIAIISAVLKQAGYKVILYDPQPFHHDKRKIIDYIVKEKPDILGMGSYTFQISQVAKFAEEVKKKLPEIKIILGGVHVTVEPKSTLEYFKAIDWLCIGEGEFVTLQLLDHLQKKLPLEEIAGLAYRKHDGSIHLNSKQQTVKNLDELPIADWDSLPTPLYWKTLAAGDTYAPIFASRGCQYSCIFCGHSIMSNSKKVRKRSPLNFVEELVYLHKKHNVKEFNFLDSTFNFDNKWVIEICEEINKKLYNKVEWQCAVRADKLKRDAILAMKRAGCVKFLIGIESGDQRVLKLMKKGESLESIEQGLALCHELDMPYDGTFILGMPGDTRESIEKTVKLCEKIIKNSKNQIGLTLATPLPGTELYEIAKAEGGSLMDWTKYNSYQISYVPKTMNRAELEKCYRKALRRLYFNAPMAIRKLKTIKTWKNLKNTFRYAGRVFKRGLNISNRK